MFNIEYIISKANKIDSRKQLETFFDNFFCERNFVDYTIKGMPNDLEYALVKEMFDDNKGAYEKAYEILKKDDFCYEAFYVFYKLSDDVTLHFYFNSIFNNINDFDMFTSYNKYVFGKIAASYIEFLRNIGNITYAIKVTKLVLAKKDLNFPVDENTLTLLYADNEIFDEFYNLYLDKGFEYIESYLRLIIVCLKHEKELIAVEISKELLYKYPYADYLDHIWDLEEINTEEANEFKKAIESCYFDFVAIPSFFSWFGSNKGTIEKS